MGHGSLAEVPAAGTNFVAGFAGRKSFSRVMAKVQCDHAGWIDGEELAVALSAADVFLMPSTQESFGLMAVESMACGTPVLVFEGTALPDIIKAPQGGLAVPAKNSEALACAIRQLLEDDALKDKLGRQARQIAEREYAFALYCQRHVELYQNAIAQHTQEKKSL